MFVLTMTFLQISCSDRIHLNSPRIRPSKFLTSISYLSRKILSFTNPATFLTDSSSFVYSSCVSFYEIQSMLVRALSKSDDEILKIISMTSLARCLYIFQSFISSNHFKHSNLSAKILVWLAKIKNIQILSALISLKLDKWFSRSRLLLMSLTSGSSLLST